MASFIYIAKDKNANPERGNINADSKNEAIEILQNRGLYVIAIDISTADKDIKKSQSSRKYGHKKIKLADLALLARQLGTLISSGVPLLRSLEITSLQCESKKMQQILVKMSHDIQEGLSFTESVSKYPKVFTSLWRGLIDTGESSGNLSQVLDQLAEYLELRQEFMRKLISTIIYPVFLLAVACIVLVFFTLFILPRFQEIFTQLDADLPFLTRFMFNFTNFVKKNFLFIIGGFIGGFFLLKHFLRTSKGRSLVDRIKLNFPLFKSFFWLYYLERFASTTSILFQSGVPIVYALEVVKRSIGNSVLEDILESIREKVKNGLSFSSGMAKARCFPPLMVEMAAIGEEVGNFPEIFKKISKHYRTNLQTRVERAASLFEPILIILVAAIVGIIVISLFLPLLQVAQSYH